MAQPHDIEAWDGAVRTRVLVGGEGPPLLFLHGSLGLVWDPFLEGLAQHHTVYAPYLPGTAPGEPDGIKPLDDVWDLVLCYDEILDALGLDTAVPVVGHSFGGMVGAELAATNPRRVSKLVLLCPIGLWRDDLGFNNPLVLELPALAQHAFADPQGPVAQAALALPEDPEAAAEMMIGITWAMGCAGKFFWPIPDRGLHKRLHRITAPTLVIWGEKDRIVSPEYADEYVRRIRSAEAEVLPDAAHVPQLEQLATTTNLVEQFLGILQPLD
jgi:pimeloyl-ACP methyl ester carboxylesterase